MSDLERLAERVADVRRAAAALDRAAYEARRPCRCELEASVIGRSVRCERPRGHGGEHHAETPDGHVQWFDDEACWP